MRRARSSASLLALLGAVAAVLAVAGPVGAEQASSRTRALQAGLLDAGGSHSCATPVDGTVRCWGDGSNGKLGYANTTPIGDTETPAWAGPVEIGAGRTATAITAGLEHSCAILDDGTVRCWGQNLIGELGYGNTTPIGDDETPATAGPVDLGTGRTAVAISAGLPVTVTTSPHTCAILDNGSVRCWGAGNFGQLGYAATNSIGNNEAPGSVGPVNLGPGRTATAIAAGGTFTCAILDDGAVRCWGDGTSGHLGYGNTTTIGDDETPAAAGPVNLGPGRTAVAISAGDAHTCAILDDGSVRCWGDGSLGRLGIGSTATIGDDETPGSVAPVNLGAGRKAVAISAGYQHTCVILDDGTVHCWGQNPFGQLGYGNFTALDVPGAAVDVGVGRSAVAIATGQNHTCALLDDGAPRCWGAGAAGRLGYGNVANVGDDEPPAAAGPVFLGGTVIGAVADLSLTVAPSTTAATVGGDVTYTVALGNAGVDASRSPQVLVRATGAPTLVSSTASAGSFDGASGIWRPGTLAAGQTATLTLVERATRIGALAVSAEVTIATTFDPDSRPANFVASEDDQASATATVAAAPTPPAPTPAPPAAPPPPPAPGKVAPEKLTLTVAPARDTTPPHAFTATGRLVATTVAAATACKGTVTVTAKAGTRTLATKTASLKLTDGACQYTAKLSISRSQRKTATTARLTAAFAGNDALLAASSKAATARLA